MRVLVTGAGGLVGGKLAELLREKGHEVVAGRHQAVGPSALPSVALDLLSEPSTRAALKEAEAEGVIHSAALADADRCEREPQLARETNVIASATLGRLCAELGLRLVALSTDLVFDGTQPLAGESVPPAPLMHYGRTKLEGEDALLAANPAAVVARTALVSGAGYGPRSTATEGIAWALAAGRPLKLFTDQFRTPLDTASLADALDALLRGEQRGRFHLGGPERLSRYELGLRVARRLGFPEGAIEPVRQADLALAAPRPADVSLDSTKARTELRWTPRSIEEAIDASRRSPAL